MTREDAVKTIEEIKNCYTNDRDLSYYGDEYHGLTTYDNAALDMAIKALSEQAEDVISRQAALDEFKRLYFDNETVLRCAEYVLKNLPSVK